MADEEVKTHTDAFGTKRGEDNAPVVDAPVQPDFVEMNGTKYVNDGTGKAKMDGAGNPMPFTAKAADASDIEQNPVVKELRAQLKKSEDGKDSMGESLSEQRKMIDDLRKKVEGGGGKQDAAGDFKAPFPEVKRVANLPKAEQDAMTDTEKRLFDQNADMMERINGSEKEKFEQAVKDKADRATETQKQKDDREADEADAEFNDDVQERVSKLTGNDRAMSNQIIEKLNQFKDNHTLKDDDLDARILEAAKLVPDYKPAAVQKPASGGTAVKSGGDNDDPFGNKAIIKEAKASTGGQSYSL